MDSERKILLVETQTRKKHLNFTHFKHSLKSMKLLSCKVSTLNETFLYNYKYCLRFHKVKFLNHSNWHSTLNCVAVILFRFVNAGKVWRKNTRFKGIVRISKNITCVGHRFGWRVDAGYTQTVRVRIPGRWRAPV